MNRKNTSFRHVAIVALVFLPSCGIMTRAALGQGIPDKPNASKPDKERNAKAAELESWIEQLTESSLTKRRKAKEALVQADAAAIPLLAKAALSDRRELIVYSLEILGTLADKSPAEETRKAARTTLQTLADSELPSTSERAKQILSSQPTDGIEAFPGWDDPNSGYGGGMNGAVKRSVSVSSVNGVKTIRIEDSGKITTFRDEPRGAIRVTLEDEGKKKKEFVAKNLADLKKKDADSHALYEQHSNGVGGGGFGGASFSGGGFSGGTQQFGGFGNSFAFGPGGVVVGKPQMVGGAVAFGNAGGQVNNEAATAMMIQQLEELKKRLADHPEMVQMLDSQIEALKKQ